MRVAFISFDFGEYSVRLVSGMAEHASVRLFLPECEVKPYLHLLSDKVDLQSFPKPRLRQPLRQMRLLRQIANQIRDFDADVVHLQSGHLWFSLAARMLGSRPLVLTVHDPSRHPGDEESARSPDWVLDRACFRAGQRIVHAPQVKDALIKRLGIPESTVHVIPHILIGDDKELKDMPEEEHLILFFGRIWGYKGLEYLIRAEPFITAKFPNAKIAIAGVGEAFERYRNMMIHPERFIVHNEHVSDEKRAELFRRASVIALPYVEASQSGVIPIAYRFGKPVVATTVGGLPAMVDDGRTGFLVPPRDERALANAINTLLADPALRRTFGENGRHKINSECSAELVARQTRAVYRAALTGSGHVTDEVMA